VNDAFSVYAFLNDSVLGEVPVGALEYEFAACS
jgi:hypothetical protein